MKVATMVSHRAVGMRNRARSKASFLLLAGILVSGSISWAQPARTTAASAERAALARRLIARLDTLTPSQGKRLRALGDEAFVALLPLVKERVREIDAKGGDSAPSELWWRLNRATDILRDVATKKRTPELFALLDLAKAPTSRRLILLCLAQKGDERLTIPSFLGILSKEKPIGFDVDRAESLDAVANSRDPRAVRFMIAQLGDPKADPRMRHDAFVNLARTGGAAGLKAVVRARDHRRTLPPLADVMHLNRLKPQKTGKDKKGVEWGLIVSDVLGSYNDLWLVQRSGARWRNPVFTGITRSQLGNGDWSRLVEQVSALSNDSDGDGLPDVVERRLGTDPHNPDTDGDGLKDGQDKNPLAAPRQLNELDQILAAAFEARFRFLEWYDVPCLVYLPQSTRPFELFGWDWVIIACRPGDRPPLARLKGTLMAFSGVRSVHFGRPLNRLPGYGVAREKGGTLLWNKDRTSANLSITMRCGNVLNEDAWDIVVTKFGSDWVVTEARCAQYWFLPSVAFP